MLPRTGHIIRPDHEGGADTAGPPPWRSPRPGRCPASASPPIRRPADPADTREVGDGQREQLYRLANATGWPASVFNAWLKGHFGVDNLDQIRTWGLADAVIRALRLLPARIEASPPAGVPD